MIRRSSSDPDGVTGRHIYSLVSQKFQLTDDSRFSPV